MRKIIGKGIFRIVQVTPGGCACPQITQLRDTDLEPIRVDEFLAEAPPLPENKITHKCRDIKTEFKMGDYPVTFRFCKCPDEINGCENLPPTQLSSNKILGVDEQECWSENGHGVYFEGLFENEMI